MDIIPKAFCTECYEKTTYELKEETTKVKVRGVSFSYPRLRCYCTECGCEVYSPEINDKNVYERHKAYYSKLDQMKGELQHGKRVQNAKFLNAETQH